MAKLHRKTTDEHPVLEDSAAGARDLLRFAKGRSLLRINASIEAATALEEWEAEGGASVAALRTSENGASPPTPLDRLLLERLGAALLGEWNSLPARLQRAVYERAVSVSAPSNRPTMRRQVARFLHDHKKPRADALAVGGT
jgi:hypothetical protein